MSHRMTYKLWEEPKAPDFALEVASANTWREDEGPKRRLYERPLSYAEAHSTRIAAESAARAAESARRVAELEASLREKEGPRGSGRGNRS